MPAFYPSFPPYLQQWALEQPLFFTATSPSSGKHINLSPKGLPSTTFTIFDENHAAYLDATGSGAETIAHLYDNGRITIMFCSFTSKPRIMRLFCTGAVVESGSKGFEQVVQRMGKRVEGGLIGVRAVIMLKIWKVQTACGYAVPTSGTLGKECPSYLDDSFQDRETLTKWLKNKTQKDALDEYTVQHNSRSLDGLPGLRKARRLNGEYLMIGDLKAWVGREVMHPLAILAGFVIGMAVSICVFQQILQKSEY